MGSAYVHTSTGEIKRRRVYGGTEHAAREKLRKLQADDGAGVPAPDKSYSVGEYLDLWLARVKEEKRATTYRGYESAVRLHIKPLLGAQAPRPAHRRRRPPVPRPLPREVPVLRQRLGQAPAGKGAVLFGEALLRTSPDDAAGPVRARGAAQRALQRDPGRADHAQRGQVRRGPDAEVQARQGPDGPGGPQAAPGGEGLPAARALRRGRDARVAPWRAARPALVRHRRRGPHRRHRADRAAGRG